MKYFSLIALVLACGVGVYSVAVKDKDGLAFASGILALAGTAHQANVSPEKGASNQREDNPN